VRLGRLAGAAKRDGGQRADELGGYRCRLRDGQAGQGTLPCGDTTAGHHAEPERERPGACVQGGMTQLFVAGVQPAARGTVLAGIRAGARFSSRVAR
jgi:hypothetical protein